MNAFELWIQNVGGARKAAKILKVSEAAVFKWLRRDASPRVALMQNIVIITKGQVTLNDIIERTTK